MVKYDGNGNMIWTKEAGRGKGRRTSNAIALDGVGNLYITGATDKSIKNPKPDTIGDIDYYVMKYDANGSVLWVEEDGANNWKLSGTSIAVDILGNVYIAGFSDRSSSNSNYLVFKYDVDGNHIWTKSNAAQKNSDYVGNGITVDNIGNCYMTGTLAYTYNGNTSYYIVNKYDSNGNYTYIDRVGVKSGTSQGNAITFKNGMLYVTGLTNVGINGQSQTGTYDSFIAAYNSLH